MFYVAPLPGQISLGYLEDNIPLLFGVDQQTATAALGEAWPVLPPVDAVDTMRRWVRTIQSWEWLLWAAA